VQHHASYQGVDDVLGWGVVGMPCRGVGHHEETWLAKESAAMTKLLILLAMAQMGGGTPAWVGSARGVLKAKRALHEAVAKLGGDSSNALEVMAGAERLLCSLKPSDDELLLSIESGQFSTESVLALVTQCGEGASGKSETLQNAKAVIGIMPKVDEIIHVDVWWFLRGLPNESVSELWPLIEGRLRGVRNWRIAQAATQMVRRGPPDTQGELLGRYFVQAPSVARWQFAVFSLGGGAASVASFRAAVLASGEKGAIEDLRTMEAP
jgi:hypothetical protein